MIKHLACDAMTGIGQISFGSDVQKIYDAKSIHYICQSMHRRYLAFDCESIRTGEQSQPGFCRQFQGNQGKILSKSSQTYIRQLVYYRFSLSLQ